MKAPQEVAEIRELIANPASVGEDGRLRPEVHAQIEELHQHIGEARPLAVVRDPSGGDR